MNKDTVERAQELAEQFFNQADLVLTEMRNENRDWLTVGTKLTGALRRTSMELTRALAEMRRPG